MRFRESSSIGNRRLILQCCESCSRSLKSVPASADLVRLPQLRLAELFVGEKRQEDFTFLTDETQESSPRISLTFFKIGIADNNCFDRRILNFRICLATVIPSTSKDTSLIDGLRSRRAIKPVDRHASNSGFAT